MIIDPGANARVDGHQNSHLLNDKLIEKGMRNWGITRWSTELREYNLIHCLLNLKLKNIPTLNRGQLFIAFFAQNNDDLVQNVGLE